MSILDLRPELLLDIFSYTVPDSPYLDHEDYLERTRSLLSLSLVHRQWTCMAQEVLLREVWLGNTNYREGELERKSRQLVQAKVKGAKYLTAEGDIESLLKVTGLERWKDVVYLKNRPEYHIYHSTRFDTFARFPDLATLNLSNANFSINRFDRSLTPSFPKLRRLVLSLRLVLQGDIQDIQRLFSPDHLPNLVHLALESPEHGSSSPAQLFCSILPHITTLALSDIIMDYSDSALFRVISRCLKLKHLSLALNSDDLESLLFTDAAGMELESLHMPSSFIGNSTTLLPRLIAVAKGEPATIKVKRVVFYGKEKSMSAIRPYMTDSDVFEWRGDRDVPPFEDFDGR